ncbi:MAG TPA: 1-deoxy-D-xylulose-5-phosphate synthase [Armatimonadota bacterium]|nr:1-deoxy-D-xylulose-5-phosphate synthase [Armatimonadota bacterium]
MPDTDRILDRINSPEDLKGLSQSDLVKLAEEMRDEIIQTVSRTGGHLASNLGVVELTIALHTVFDSPRDKILWDVSHQAYPHKLLTGRRERFFTLRQEGGLSGFVRRDESEHDPFGAGHASTSISAALGLAKARDLRGGSEEVIAVIGDGALTGGLALEGMNNAQDLDTDVIIVLNDNEMSIAENVTALSYHLAKLRMDPLYQSIENRAKNTLERSSIGKRLARTAEGLSHGVTHLIGAKNGIIFEELGFRYLGPIDGHNITLLMEVFENAKKIRGPVLIHVQTIKGKGYEHAEANSRKFHGISGFTVADGKIEKTNGFSSFKDAFEETLIELAEKDPRITAITAAMPDGTGLAAFSKRFPDRYFDVGIAEEHAVTFAAGLAAGGIRPVVAIYSTFLQRAYDQIIHDVCIQNLPVVFVLDRAGIVGEDGPTHHGAFDLSYLRHIPGMTLMAPRDTNQLRDMLLTALTHDGPIAIRYPRGGGPTAYEHKSPSLLTIGQSEQLRSGNDVCILAVGPVVYSALKAADILAEEGISVQVIDARFVKPLDEKAILKAVKQCGHLVVVEENTKLGGLGSAVLELFASECINVPVKLMGLPDRFIEHATPESILQSLGLSAEGIVQSVREICGKAGLVDNQPKTQPAEA